MGYIGLHALDQCSLQPSFAVVMTCTSQTINWPLRLQWGCDWCRKFMKCCQQLLYRPVLGLWEVATIAHCIMYVDLMKPCDVRSWSERWFNRILIFISANILSHRSTQYLSFLACIDSVIWSEIIDQIPSLDFLTLVFLKWRAPIMSLIYSSCRFEAGRLLHGCSE